MAPTLLPFLFTDTDLALSQVLAHLQWQTKTGMSEYVTAYAVRTRTRPHGVTVWIVEEAESTGVWMMTETAFLDVSSEGNNPNLAGQRMVSVTEYGDNREPKEARNEIVAVRR